MANFRKEREEIVKDQRLDGLDERMECVCGLGKWIRGKEWERRTEGRLGDGVGEDKALGGIGEFATNGRDGGTSWGLGEKMGNGEELECQECGRKLDGGKKEKGVAKPGRKGER